MKSAISEAFDSWLVFSTNHDRTTTGKCGDRVARCHWILILILLERLLAHFRFLVC